MERSASLRSARRQQPPMRVAVGRNRLQASIAVVVGLVGTLDRHADVVGLLLRQVRQLDPKVVEVQAGNLLVEVLRQAVNPYLELLLPELHLGQALVGEGARHDERDGP